MWLVFKVVWQVDRGRPIVGGSWRNGEVKRQRVIEMSMEIGMLNF